MIFAHVVLIPCKIVTLTPTESLLYYLIRRTALKMQSYQSYTHWLEIHNVPFCFKRLIIVSNRMLYIQMCAIRLCFEWRLVTSCE
jgi:hypothetical protein